MNIVQSNTNPTLTSRETGIEHFNSIYDQYATAIYKYALMYTRSTQDAEDITQDSFAQLWSQWTRIGEIENLKGYLFRIARNYCHNSYRRLTRYKNFLPGYHRYKPDYSFLDLTIEKEFNIIYLRAINLLSVKQQQVFILRDSDFTPQEIADKLQLSTFTIYNHISAALRKVRTIVREELQIRFEEEMNSDCSNQPARAA